MRYVFALIVVVFGILGFSACTVGSPSTPVAEQVAAPTMAATEPPLLEESPMLEPPLPTASVSTTAYPGPQAPDERGYPAPDARVALEATLQALPTLPPLPTPEPGKGHIVGQIMRESEIRPREPLAGWTLYLGQVHRNVSGQIVPLASVVEEIAPKAVTDAQGRYAFTNVEPGLYALIIKHPLTLVLAHDLLTDQDVVIEVTEGEVTEQPLVVVTISD